VLVGYATIRVNATRRRVLLPYRRSLQLLPMFGTAAQNDVELHSVLSISWRIDESDLFRYATAKRTRVPVIA
jgi:hypothetical protein